MRIVGLLIAAMAAIAWLSGCAATINQESIVPSAVPLMLVADLTAAKENFAATGYTTEAQCMADALAKLHPTPGVDLKVTGLVSLGSVGYIAVDQVQKQLGQGPNALSPACLQIVGKVVLSVGQQAGKKFLPIQ